MSWERVIRHLGDLALLDVGPEEFERLSSDIERIVRMFNEIKELNIPDEVEPLYSVFFGEVNLRDDVESDLIDMRELDPSGRRFERGYLRSPRML